jgi:FMN phosphatase YigB (HAD superfamily)
MRRRPLTFSGRGGFLGRTLGIEEEHAVLKALLLDLDGTLLNLDGDQFLEDYIEAVAHWMGPLTDPGRFTDTLWSAAIPVMVTQHPGRSNRDVLWEAMGQALNVDPHQLDDRLREFLSGDLSVISPGGEPVPGAERVVAVARARRVKLAVATMPIYPRAVVLERLRRAHLGEVPWDLVATDGMETVKPDLAYFQEIAESLGVEPTECLMVGDDYFRDIVARKAGMATFYVGPARPRLDTGLSGTLWDLAERLDAGWDEA